MQYFFKAISLVSTIAAELPEIVSDGKITVSELIVLGTKIAKQLGYDVDAEGFDLDGLS